MLGQKVVVDDNGNVTEIEVPFFGKLKTNVPSLVSIFLGVALVAFIVNKVTVTRDFIPLFATLSFEGAEYSPDLFVGAIPNEYIRVGSAIEGTNSEFQINVDRSGEYSVVAMALVEVRDGRPIYDLVQGSAVRDADSKAMRFSGLFGQ